MFIKAFMVDNRSPVNNQFSQGYKNTLIKIISYKFYTLIIIFGFLFS